jgi:G:T-mismatch repair DNA endonuclease (very short patch repair protein)
MARKFASTDIDNMINRYKSGETQQQIGDAFGIKQGTVSNLLKRHGANISRTEAANRRYARMTPTERAKVADAAHDAVRGMTRGESDLVKRAGTKQVRESHATSEERVIAKTIKGLGVDPVVLQEATGKYNLDIGAFPVAVELFGGGWHAHGKHRARLGQRVEDIADRGWNQLIVWTHTVHPLNVAAVAKDIAAYHELSRSNPSFRRQYRMIWGDGQFISAGCVDDDDVALVPTGIRGAYTRGGRD